MKTIVVISGGFDPVHCGHIQLLKKASALGDKLIVGLNSDDWLTRKKGRPFMRLDERRNILESIKWVDEVWEFDDSDDSACDLLRRVKQYYSRILSFKDSIVFANGGDRTQENIPEMIIDDVEFVFGVGGDNKANSSSWILQEWKAAKTERPWGYYRVLHEVNNHVKLKELTVAPNTCLSMQRHKNRSEFWFVVEGEAAVYTLDSSTDHDLIGYYKPYEHIFIEKNQWHMLCNETDHPLKLIEIQYGKTCVEEDIERK